jgi:hypothetical protein
MTWLWRFSPLAPLLAHRNPKRRGDVVRHTGPEGDDPVKVAHEERRARAIDAIDMAFREVERKEAASDREGSVGLIEGLR